MADQSPEANMNYDTGDTAVHIEKENSIWEVGADGKNPCYVTSLPNEILAIIIKLVINNPANSPRIGPNVDLTIHPGFTHTHPIVDKLEHYRVRSVCRTWARHIDPIYLEVHLDGNDAPGPMFEWNEETQEEEIPLSALKDKNGEDIIAGEVHRARFHLSRIPEKSPFNLTLINPRYDPHKDPRHRNRYGAALVRPGVLEMINSAPKSDIATLTISDDRDMEWTQFLLDEEGERLEFEWDARDRPLALLSFHAAYERMMNVEKSVNTGKEPEENSDGKVWKRLHTLRLMFSGPEQYNMYFAKIPPVTFPALRCVELHLHRDENLRLWVLPYSQLTHLILSTDATNVMLLEILKLSRLSLESVILRFLPKDEERYCHYQHRGPCISLPKLKVLRMHSKGIGWNVESFFDALKCRRLRTLDITVESHLGVEALTAASIFIARSGCTLRELYIDTLALYFSHDDYAGLKTLLEVHSNALEVLHIHANPFGSNWLDHLTAPRLRELDVICFGIEELAHIPAGSSWPGRLECKAEGYALRLLHWIEAWSTKHCGNRQSQLKARFRAAPHTHIICVPHCKQHGDIFSGMEIVTEPRTIEAMKDRLGEEGLKVSVEWWMSKSNVGAYDAARSSLTGR
ncbi:hypothetical protein DFP72DRAFT_1075821 [Ephemerocybe angulata]|uniref:F-box domain-containing protein n=1 Tax=Ephemerocybe angulata TaxID=980116 RepID=A0A8H6HIG6_9AGAR|nr:hypothetical protein DFP72DRAFT_1075821 [Tulosesus angulatus]